jgi:2-dehydropantoate 2-reductase
MNIAIFGAGGVGGYFGGLLAQAGHEVTFIARGDHLTAIRQNGLKVLSVNGDFTISPAEATEDPADVGPVDYVILGVKHYHLPDVAPQIKPLVGPNTTVVPLLNGVDAHDYLIESLGPKPVVGGLCSIVAMIESPGVIRQLSKLRRVIVGELDYRKSERVDKLIQAWKACGAEAIHAEDIHAAMWTKYLFISSLGGVSSLARVSIGELRENAHTRKLYADAMREVEALARAQDIQLAPDVVASALELTDSFEPSATSSMQRDVTSGSPFELEAFSGKIVRLGKELGVSTPVHEAMYALLLPSLERATSG